MPRAQQLALVTGALWAATANAAGIRVHGDVSVAPPAARRLQSTLPDGLVTTDLGCYRDSQSDRVLQSGLMGQSDMTPDVCAAYCLDKGSYTFYGVQYGQECWCGRAGTEYDRLGALEMSECDYPCTGDASSTCGGFDSFQAFELGALDQPEGYLGCFVDSQSSRLFSAPLVASASNTAETCKATCAGFAYYGLQYSEECFCGLAEEDYTRLGTSDACGYRCSGDVLSTCGGFNAMDVFAMDAGVTSPPATAPPTTLPPGTAPPVSAPPTTAPPATAPPATAPPATAPTHTHTPQCSFTCRCDCGDGLFVWGGNNVVITRYVDSAGDPYLSGAGGDQENAAVLSYTGADGHEELHVFNTIGWFDTGAWPWAHFYNEWATKGIFMGERRFYLGAVVDDLFLSTPEFEYDGGTNEAAVAQRCTGQDLSNLLGVQQSLNTQYSGSEIITEFAFNGGGIAEHVSQSVEDISYVPNYEETMVTLKGTKWFEDGQINVHDTNWLATNVPLMQQDMADGTWEANDDLLAEVISHLDTPSTFYHGHHTLIHLSRDQLRESDCVTEDTGNVQIALMTGMWDSDNYNWRSMVSPGITGLFNENCLDSAAQNLMVCYPGDNTFDGTVSGAAILINEDNQFHSIYTTVSNNGYDGGQIVPRFATFVYFNCVSGTQLPCCAMIARPVSIFVHLVYFPFPGASFQCLVNENEYIRRFVCECTPLDPSIADYVSFLETAGR
ncbi:unnamed protein product [Ectocarpus sp. CCAP 1310/34]|nr:unnamed protein product [Ectocarpus sp. CCAP 1310/34]